MSIINSTLKIIFICLPLIFLLNCAESKSIPPLTVPETQVTVVQTTPSPFLGQKAKVQGENKAIEITDNLKDSVKQQELPKIWLEFSQKDGKVLKTELNNEFNENLKFAGEALFRYQYVIKHSENPDERYDASYDQLMIFEKTLNRMSKLEIDSPDGKRKLTEDEISEMLHKQSGLINDRYEELDDYFYPKSSFYKFRKSVNEKLGYSIF